MYQANEEKNTSKQVGEVETDTFSHSCHNLPAPHIVTRNWKGTHNPHMYQTEKEFLANYHSQGPTEKQKTKDVQSFGERGA